jgi:outer membrane protein assembly factor BamA
MGIIIFTMISLVILNVVAPLWYNTRFSVNNPGSAAKLMNAGSNIGRSSGNDYRVYQLYTNTKVEIKSLGFGLGLSRKVYKDFEVGVNYNYAEFNFDQAKDPSFEAGFNTNTE